MTETKTEPPSAIAELVALADEYADTPLAEVPDEVLERLGGSEASKELTRRFNSALRDNRPRADQPGQGSARAAEIMRAAGGRSMGDALTRGAYTSSVEHPDTRFRRAVVLAEIEAIRARKAERLEADRQAQLVACAIHVQMASEAPPLPLNPKRYDPWPRPYVAINRYGREDPDDLRHENAALGTPSEVVARATHRR
jgi:hypothetical protein